MSTKSMEERVSALESCAFRTGRDLAEIKSVQREHTGQLAVLGERLTGVEQRLIGVEQQLTGVDERVTGLDERMVRLEHGVGLLLDHYGIQRPRA